MNQQAFVLRITPGGHDKVPKALTEDQIIIGWSKVKGLLDEKLSWEEFRKIIRDTYYTSKAGAAAGHMCRFIRERSFDLSIWMTNGRNSGVTL